MKSTFSKISKTVIVCFYSYQQRIVYDLMILYVPIFFNLGPISRTIDNSKEVPRAIICSIELSLNQTKAKLALRLVPIIDVMIEMQVRCYSVFFCFTYVRLSVCLFI